MAAPVTTIIRRPRVGAWRRRYLPFPDEMIDAHLREDEYVIHADHPTFGYFVGANILFIALLVAAGLTVATNSLTTGVDDGMVAVAASVIIANVTLLILAFKRLRSRYSFFVITNLRVLRTWGVFRRRATALSWTRVIGISCRATRFDRFLGRATVGIESASRRSGLHAVSSLNNPWSFHALMSVCIAATHGEPGVEMPGPVKGQPRHSRRRATRPNEVSLRHGDSLTAAERYAADWERRRRPNDNSGDTT